MDASTLAAQTVDRARSAMQSTRIASLPEVVKLLRALTGSGQQVSVLELAEIIQSDAVVMAKVVGAANMFAYNPKGMEVTSVSQAIHVIGYERIRTLAMSLMLAEQISRVQTPDTQREYAAQSLMAGCLAQALAGSRTIVDQQKAFICASLRNFGQIVLSAAMPDEFGELRKQAGGGEPDEAAYRETFGLTPLELGYQLLDSASLPEEILVTLRATPSEALAALQRKPDDELLALASFAGELSALTLDPRSNPEEFAQKADALARNYEHVLPLLHEEIHHVMDAASQQLDQIVRTFRIKSLPPRLSMRLSKCRRAVDPNRPMVASAPPTNGPAATNSPPSATSGSASPAAKAPDGASTPESAKPVDALPAHDWNGSLEQLTGLMRQPGMSQSTLYAALVQTVRTGLGAKECLLFNAAPGSAEFPLVHGAGEVYGDLRVGVVRKIVPGERTVFGVCVSRNENIIIHHAREEKIQAYLPEWLTSHASFLGAFILLPVGDGARVGGVVLAGWPEARQIVLPPESARIIRAMLTLTCRVGPRLRA